MGRCRPSLQSEALVENYQPISNLFENRWTDAGGVPAGFHGFPVGRILDICNHTYQSGCTYRYFVGRPTEYGFVSKTEFEQMPILEQLQLETTDDIFYFISCLGLGKSIKKTTIQQICGTF